MFRISIISKDTKFTLKSLDPAKVKILQHNYSRAPARIENITANIASVRDNGQATGNTTLQNARSGPGLSADRRYLTLVAVDRLPNTSQPSGWQGATGSSLRVDLYQQPVG